MSTLKLFLTAGIVACVGSCVAQPFVSNQNPYSLLGSLPQGTPLEDLFGSEIFTITGRLPQQITVPIENPTFRQLVDIVLVNNGAAQLVETRIAAWIQQSSLPTDPEDRAVAESELQGDGWRLQQEDLVLGRLRVEGPVYIYRGGRTDNGVSIDIKIAQVGVNLADLRDSIGVVVEPRITLLSPDGILLFNDFPDSCESVAFLYTENGVPVSGSSDFQGGRKLFRQVQFYQCDPFEPGFYLNTGGARQSNEYSEGDVIVIEFNPGPAQGKFALVQFTSR